MSVIFNCGFARVAVKESFRKVGSASVETNPSEKWKNYLAAFECDSREVFAVERSTYVKKTKAVFSSFRKMNSKARAQYQDTFSMVNWKALNTAQKKQHTLSNCGGCQVHYYGIHNFFPSGETFKTQKLLKEALIESGVKTQSKVKPTQKAIKTAVKHVEKIFKINFAEAQTKVKELQLQKRKTQLRKSGSVEGEHAKKKIKSNANV